MPGIDGYEPGDALILRTFKRKTTNPAIVWSNSYEFVAYQGGGVAELLNAAGTFVEFEKDLHGTTTEFVRATFSTWVPDSRPYNPQTFLVSDLTGTLATRVELSGGPAPLNMTWGLKRQTLTGRSGKLFLRNAVMQDEIVAPAGVAAFANVVTMAGLVLDAVMNNGVDEYFGITPANGLGLVLKGRHKNPEGGYTDTLIPVTGIASWSPTYLPVDHKYYDIPEPTP